MKALEACAAFIASALRKHFNETGFNGLSWQQLVALAAEQGLKPKTMRLGRAHLRDKLKQLILYRSKMPGSRDTRYLWALAEFPLPENSEVISHDPEEEVCTFIAAVKAGVRTLSPSDGGAMQPGMPMQMYSSAAGVGRRLSDGSTGSMLGYQPSLSPRDSTPDNCQDGGNPSSRRRFIPYCELEKQFGVGVSKAAANLGICKTTLKRICRQHGIKQWPRRQIAKALSHLSGHEQGSSSEGTATVPSLMPTPSDTCMPLTLADAGPLNLSLLSASSSLNHGMPQPFTSNYEPLGLSIRTSHMQGAPSTIDAMGRPTNVLTLTGRPTGMQGGGLLGTRSFSDDLSWSSSASPHAGQLQMQGALPQLSLGASGGLGSSGPGNAGLPWVQLHQLGNQLGMSCPVYVMLPNRGM